MLVESVSDIPLMQWTTKQEAHCFSYGSITLFAVNTTMDDKVELRGSYFFNIQSA